MLKKLAVLCIIFSTLYLVNLAKAEEVLSAKPVICNDDLSSLRNFYKAYNLYPAIGGGARVRINETDQNLTDVVIYLLLDDKGSAAIVEYHEGFACVLAFIHDISFDTEAMKGYLKLNEDF